MGHALKTIDRFYGLTPRGIIHVGANSGQEVPDYMASDITPVVLIEPLQIPFKRLLKSIDNAEGFFPVQKCLSDVAGKTVIFNVASNSGQASSYYEPENHLTIYPGVTFGEKIEFTTETLDAVVQGLSGSLDRSKLDYISLDTQGSELDIIKGASRCLEDAKFVFLEVSFKGLYRDAPDMYEVIQFMRSKEFDLYHCLMRNKGWGDALFIKRGVVL